MPSPTRRHTNQDFASSIGILLASENMSVRHRKTIRNKLELGLLEWVPDGQGNELTLIRQRFSW